MSVTGENQSVVNDKFTFLKDLTSGKRHNGGKSFYQHLFNVYSYLVSQSCPPEVCDAGLFHAIYGTEFYDFQSSAVTRDVVRGFIGQYAEELAHVFCGLRSGRFRSIVENTPGWNTKQHLDLCWVEYANLWDHREFRNVDERLETLGLKIGELNRVAFEMDEFVSPPYPPPLLSPDQAAFLSYHGWLAVDLPDDTQMAFQNVLAETKSFFALDANVKRDKYPSGRDGFYTVPEEKEHVTIRYRANPESLLEHHVEDSWEKAAKLLYRILCDLAHFHGYDPRMWDPFVENSLRLPQNESCITDISTFMRLFQYYPEGGLAEQHTDLGLLTLCVGSDSGLEVVEHSPEASRWISTQKPVILVGRVASMLLHRNVRPGRHRVVSNSQGRRSVIFALRPCPTAQIDLNYVDGQQTISAREYIKKISGHNVNAKKDRREEQKQEYKLRREENNRIISILPTVKGSSLSS